MSDETDCWDAWFAGLAAALQRRDEPQPQVFPMYSPIASPERNPVEIVDVGSFYPPLPYEFR